MSAASVLLFRPARIAVAVALCLSASVLAAQETPNASTPVEAAPVEDPGMVIARTINPRIAYRGIPTEENPIHTEATLFPARTFHAALDGTIGELLGDEALGARGSAGIHAGAAVQSAIGEIFPGESSTLGSNMGMGATSTGAGAAMGGMGVGAFGGTVGRAVGSGTSGFGGVLGVMPALMPAQQGGGR